jgi:hypothetical protein
MNVPVLEINAAVGEGKCFQKLRSNFFPTAGTLREVPSLWGVPEDRKVGWRQGGRLPPFLLSIMVKKASDTGKEDGGGL